MIRHKWVICAELIAAAPTLVLDRAIDKAIQRLQVFPFSVVDIQQRCWLSLRFGQQALLDHLTDIGAGQGQTGLETPLNLGEVLPNSAAQLPQHALQIALRGDKHPRPPLANRAE